MFRLAVAGYCLGAALASFENEDVAASLDITPAAQPAALAGDSATAAQESEVFTTSTMVRSSVTTNAVPTENCAFEVEPATPHAWDPKCVEPLEDTTGCLADGIHKECRFCGAEGFPPCPTCEFQGAPVTPFTWDKKCRPGGYTKGCFADGRHFECRWCGDEDGIFDPCPFTTVSSTTFESTTTAMVSNTNDFDVAGDAKAGDLESAPPSASSSGTASPPASSAFSEAEGVGSHQHTSGSPLAHDLEVEASTTFLQKETAAAALPGSLSPAVVVAFAAGTLLRHG